MKTVTAYLSFDGNCRQAVSFYQQCLSTELELNPYPDATGQPSSDPSARIMHAQLMRRGAPILMASDSPQPGSLRPGNNFSVSLDCESLDEQERLFNALSRGGNVTMPLMDALHHGAPGSACLPTNLASSGCSTATCGRMGSWSLRARHPGAFPAQPAITSETASHSYDGIEPKCSTSNLHPSASRRNTDVPRPEPLAGRPLISPVQLKSKRYTAISDPR
jgi:PhnB protein